VTVSAMSAMACQGEAYLSMYTSSSHQPMMRIMLWPAVDAAVDVFPEDLFERPGVGEPAPLSRGAPEHAARHRTLADLAALSAVGPQSVGVILARELAHVLELRSGVEASLELVGEEHWHDLLAPFDQGTHLATPAGLVRVVGLAGLAERDGRLSAPPLPALPAELPGDLLVDREGVCVGVVDALVLFVRFVHWSFPLLKITIREVIRMPETRSWK